MLILSICNKIVLQNVQVDSGSDAIQVAHESCYVVVWDDREACNVVDVELKASGGGHVNSKVQKSHTPLSYTAYCKQLPIGAKLYIWSTRVYQRNSYLFLPSGCCTAGMSSTNMSHDVKILYVGGRPTNYASYTNFGRSSHLHWYVYY